MRIFGYRRNPEKSATPLDGEILIAAASYFRDKLGRNDVAEFLEKDPEYISAMESLQTALGEGVVDAATNDEDSRI